MITVGFPAARASPPSNRRGRYTRRPRSRRVVLKTITADQLYHVFMTSGGPPCGGSCAVPPPEQRAERPRLAADGVRSRGLEPMCARASPQICPCEECKQQAEAY